jgi:SAM-dependent methyltransferase
MFIACRPSPRAGKRWPLTDPGSQSVRQVDHRLFGRPIVQMLVFQRDAPVREYSNLITAMEREPTSPLTGTPYVRFVKTTPSAQVVRNWREHFGIDVEEELRGTASIALFECLGSGLRFFVPNDIAGSTRLYQQLQKFDWYYMSDKWEHTVALKDLRGCHRVLEIGSGAGAFIQRLQHLGFSVEGIELNEDALVTARDAGLPVRQMTLDELFHAGRRYDAICAFQVLEHVPDPKAFVADIIQLLNDGGRLILSVPDHDSFIKHASLHLLDEPPHHMTQWTEKVLAFLTGIFPLDIDTVRHEPLAPYHVTWYSSIQAGRWIVGGPFVRRVVQAIVERLLRVDRVRRTIRGHTIYVCFRMRERRGS